MKQENLSLIRFCKNLLEGFNQQEQQVNFIMTKLSFCIYCVHNCAVA